MEGKRVLMMDIDPQGVETGLVNIMSRETVLRQYVDSVKITMTMYCWTAFLVIMQDHMTTNTLIWR